MKAKIEILRYIQSKKKIKLSELAKRYELSAPTIRRYVLEWEQEGIVKRSHGMVYALNKSFLPLKLRMIENVEQKKAIAKKATSLVNEGDTIFLGGGATVAYMCEYLTSFKKLNVITNSLYIINFFSNYKDISIISIGGILLYEDDVFTGNFTQILYEKLYADKVFLGTEAIHYQIGLSKALRLEELNEHFMLNRGQQKIILASSDKINKVLPLITTPIDDIDIIITDTDIDKSDIDHFKEANVQITTSKVSESK